MAIDWAEEGRFGIEPEAGPPPAGRLSDVLYQFRGNPATIAGATILGLVVLAALIVPEFPPYPPYAVDITHASIGPTWAHPFRTNQYGHDIFTRVLIAARLDLIIALSAVAFSLSIGVLIDAAAALLLRS